MNHARSLGVMKSEGPSPKEVENLPNNTILSALPAQMVFVQYVERGRLIQGLVIVTANGDMYLDKNGASYTRDSLQQVTPKFRENLSQVLSAMQVQPDPLPSDVESVIKEESSVDAVASAMAGEG